MFNKVRSSDGYYITILNRLVAETPDESRKGPQRAIIEKLLSIIVPWGDRITNYPLAR